MYLHRVPVAAALTGAVVVPASTVAPAATAAERHPARRGALGRRLAAVAALLLLGACAAGPQERRLGVRGALDLRAAGRSEVVVVRDAWGFTVDPVRPLAPGLGGDFSGVEPGLVLLGVPGFLAMQLVALGNGAVLATAVDVAQGGYADGERRVLLAAEGKALDAAVADEVVAHLQRTLPGRVVRGADHAIPRPTPGSAGPPDPARMPAVSAEGRSVRVQVRTLFQGLQRRQPVGVADGSAVLETSPPLALVVALQVLATTEIEERGRRREAFVGGITVHCESPSRLMGAWSADQARMLRAELATVQAEVIAQVRTRLGGAAPAP